MESILIKNYTKKIRGKTLLDDINLSFQEGNIYCLRGENGSGKTMLLRAISGLILPDQGEIYVQGKKLTEENRFPQSLGLLLENPSFITYMTAFQNLKTITEIEGLVKDQEIDEMIEKVGLYDHREKRASQYSLGMKERLGIAMALVERPDIILLDEPTNGLDDFGVERILDLIKEMKEERTIIIASHQMDLIRPIADFTISLKKGKVEEII